MLFHEFLTSPIDFSRAARIINFVSPQYSPLFFSLYISRLKKQYPQIAISMYALADYDAQLQAKFEMQFLGNPSVYLIVPDSDQKTKVDLTLHTYLEKYQGGHTIMIYTKPEHALKESNKVLRIMVPDRIDHEMYQKLHEFFLPSEATGTVSTKSQTPFSQQLFNRFTTVQLDIGCMMMQYQILVGKNVQQFFDEWFPKIAPAHASLFTLSQYLFARNGKLFYQEWKVLVEEYPIEFWIAFWSEQLWQAIVFVNAAQQHGPIEAKKSVSRLPFSFMQKDWRSYTVTELAKAYDSLYQLDYASKNGALTEGLDLLYVQFFHKK